MFLAIFKLLKLLVAKDGIEAPTPAFSGRLPYRESGLKAMDITEREGLMT